jgi:hypothetical protein
MFWRFFLANEHRRFILRKFNQQTKSDGAKFSRLMWPCRIRFLYELQQVKSTSSTKTQSTFPLLSFVLRHSKLHVSRQCELQIFIFKSLKNSNSFQIKDEFKSWISSYCTCRFSPFIILLQPPTIALPSKSPSISTHNRQTRTFTLPLFIVLLGSEFEEIIPSTFAKLWIEIKWEMFSPHKHLRCGESYARVSFLAGNFDRFQICSSSVDFCLNRNTKSFPANLNGVSKILYKHSALADFKPQRHMFYERFWLNEVGFLCLLNLSRKLFGWSFVQGTLK